LCCVVSGVAFSIASILCYHIITHQQFGIMLRSRGGGGGGHHHPNNDDDDDNDNDNNTSYIATASNKSRRSMKKPKQSSASASASSSTTRTWLLSRVIIIFVAFISIYTFLLIIQQQIQESSSQKVQSSSLRNNNNKKEVVGVASVARKSAAVAAVVAETEDAAEDGSSSGKQQRHRSKPIHDESFQKILRNLHRHKNDYDHLLHPQTTLFTNDENRTKTKSQEMIKRDKAGNIVYKPMTSFRKEDLGITDEDASSMKDVTYEDAIQGREKLVNTLYEAGIEDIDVPSILSLPKWESITKLYGDGPVVLGLEHCSEFQNNQMKYPDWDKSIGTAGLFNTGTNPFAMYLENNCKMPKNKSDKHGGTRWQVPWGKHCLAYVINQKFHIFLLLFFCSLSNTVFSPSLQITSIDEYCWT
jgi:hypothetical protein